MNQQKFWGVDFGMSLGTQTEAGFQPDSGMPRASTKTFVFGTHYQYLR